MGNNTSSTRKSVATTRSSGGVRKSSSAKDTHHNLDEEFSDMILHEVRNQQPAQGLIPISSIPRDSGPAGGIGEHGAPDHGDISYNQFSNDLIEDEYNELNDGLIDSDMVEVSRSFLPQDYGDSMEIDNMGHSPDETLSKPNTSSSDTPPPELSKINFRRISTDGNEDKVFANIDEHHYQQLTSENNPYNNQIHDNRLIPVEIKWVNSQKEDIRKISIIGSFSNWKDIIRLKPSPIYENEFTVTINLTLGVHKLLYIVNNEYRVSGQLPTATDQEGIFFNWFEVLDESRLFNHIENQQNHIGASTDYDANIITQTAGKLDVDRIQKKSNSFLTKISKESDNFEHIEYKDPKSSVPDSHDCTPTPDTNSSSKNYVPYHDSLSTSFLNNQQQSTISYSSEIPEMFVDYEYFKDKSPNYELPEPPQLPAHLNNVLLNKISANQHQNHANSIPHLADTTRNAPDFSHNNVHKRPPLRRADSSYYASNKEAYHLSIPNHVILNHLMTTSIRNDVLTVACITRYSGKFVTQIMHSPADN